MVFHVDVCVGTMIVVFVAYAVIVCCVALFENMKYSVWVPSVTLAANIVLPVMSVVSDWLKWMFTLVALSKALRCGRTGM